LNRVGFAVLVLSVLLLSNPASALTAPEQALADEFDAWFHRETQFEDILGAAFVVVTGEGIVRIGTAGYTDTRRTTAIGPDTAFRIASVSKTFAGELTALMVTDGMLNWDDPVTLYLPAFRIKGDASKILIRDLIGQSTGLVPHAYDNLIEDGRLPGDILGKLANLPYICPPGECYSYQNTVFSMIEPVIERVTDSSYASLIDRRIFKPLNMATASVGYEAFMANNDRAEPHVRRNGRWRTIPVTPNYYRIAPAAGINASIRDLGKWLMAQLGANPAVISPEMVDLVTVPRVRTPRDLYRKEWRQILTDAHYGLGWRIYEIGKEHINYHSGWVSGYRADVAWSGSHNIGIAILMNVESTTISTMTTRFWNLAFARLNPGVKLVSP